MRSVACHWRGKARRGAGRGLGGTAQEAVVCCFVTWLFSLQMMASADPDPTCSPASSGGFSFSISDSLQLTRRWNPLTFVVVALAVCWHTAAPRPHTKSARHRLPAAWVLKVQTVFPVTGRIFPAQHSVKIYSSKNTTEIYSCGF